MGNRQAQTPNVIMLGLDGSGKSTLLYRLLNESHRLIEDEDTTDDDKILSPSNSVPKQIINGTTIGFNVETIGSLKVTDVGGGKAMRPLWKNYINGKNLKGIIFVYDSSDTQRMKLCKRVLHNNILNEKQLKAVPLLIYSNKTDLSTSNNPLSVYTLRNKQKIENMLELNKIKHRKYSIHCVSAINDNSMFNIEALITGFQWFTNQILHTDIHIQKSIPIKATHQKSLSTGFLNVSFGFSANTTPMSSRKTTRTSKGTESIALFMDKFMKTDFERNEHKHAQQMQSNGEPTLEEQMSISKMPGLKAMECMEDTCLFFFMFGLSGAGKTTIVYHLKYGCFYSVGTHLSYENVQFLEYNGINVGIYECDPFRAGKLLKSHVIVKKYQNRINGLMFVMDGNNRDRFDEIKTMLTNCSLLQENNSIPLLIVVNTRMSDNAPITREELMAKLNVFYEKKVEYNVAWMQSLYKDVDISDKILKIIVSYLPKIQMLQYRYEQSIRDCSVYFMNGFTGNGIEYGMDWLVINAKKTHSQQLHIAQSQKGTNMKDKNSMPPYQSSIDFADELMDQDSENDNELITSQESVVSVDQIASGVPLPITNAIWCHR